MKKGWEMKQLGDVCVAENDQNGRKDIPYVGMEDIESGTGRFIGSINPRSVKSSTFLFTPDHMLYGRLRPYLNKVLLPDFVGHCSTEIFPLKVNSNLAKRFLFYWISSEPIVKTINKTCTGARMPRANLKYIFNLEIPIPPLPEQHRIVAILDEAFAAIVKAKENAEKNLANAREVFEAYLQSVFANRGEGWEDKALAEIAATFSRGRSKHRPRNDESLYCGAYPFIQTGDIRNCNHYITEYSQTYNEAGLAQSKLWSKGTICITIAANIAETGVLTFDACFPDNVIGLVVNDKFADRNFVKYLLQSFKVTLQDLGKGSAQANINLGTFENELFPFPNVAEQKNIVTKLNALASETQKLETIYQQKLADLDELKKSILEKAFAGEL